MPRRPLLALTLFAAWACSEPAATKPAAAVPPPSAAPLAQAPPKAELFSASAPAEEAWPEAVDRSLPAPGRFRLEAVRPDGQRALVRTGGLTDRMQTMPDGRTYRVGQSYYASIDLPRGCFEATYVFPAIDRAGATGTVGEALAALNAPEARADVERARALAAEFGLGAGPLVAAPDGAYAALEANNQIYLARGANAPFRHVGGAASGVEPSADGKRVAFGFCGSPCGGTYRAAQLDLGTGARRTLGVTNAHELYAEASGTWLATTDDGQRARPAKNICLIRLDPRRAGEEKLACVPSEVHSTTISARSPDGRMVALHTEGPGNDRVVVFDAQTKQKVNEVAGRPIYLEVDNAGHVAWDENDSVVVGWNGAVTPAASDVTAVGFAPDGRLIVGQAKARGFDDQSPPPTLRDMPRCGHLKALPARQLPRPPVGPAPAHADDTAAAPESCDRMRPWRR